MDEARSWGQMAALWTAMKAPVAEYDPAARSRSGLTGGAGPGLEGEGPGLCPPILRQVIAAALKTGECNACMKRIVAAPTAGASGVLPRCSSPSRPGTAWTTAGWWRPSMWRPASDR